MEIWNDPDPDPESTISSTITTISPSVSPASSEPPLARIFPLTQYQSALVSRYTLHTGFVADLENDIVDIQVDIGRDRGHVGIEYYEKELAKAQENLQRHKDEKGRKERALKQEEERLKKVVGDGVELAKKQLTEIGFHLGRDSTIVCLR